MAIARYLADPAVVADHRYADVMSAFEEVAIATAEDGFDLNDIMRLVGQRLCELIGVSRCSVYLRRHDSMFQGRAGWCRGADIGNHIRELVSGMENDQFTAEIVATGSPVLVRDAPHDPRTMQATMRRWRVQDMLGVPLTVAGDVIGIIYVDNEDEPHAYTDREIAIAQAFASLTGVAVRQASLYTELEERARVIDRQRAMLQHLGNTDRRLTQAILDGADLQSLLHLICELVGKPLLVYSPTFEVVAWATPEGMAADRPPALTERALRIPWVKHTIARAQTTGGATLLPPAPELGSPVRRLLCRLTIDGSIAGYVDVIELGGRLRAIDAKVIERAAIAIALQLLADRRQAEAEGLARQDFLADLFHGRRAANQLRRRAPLFGLDPARPHVVVRLAYDEDSDGETGLSRRQAAENQVRSLFGPASSVLSTGVPGADLLVVSLDGQLDVEAIEETFREHFGKFRSSGADYVIVSQECPTLEDLPRASQEIRDIAALLASVDAPPQVAVAREMRLLRLVASQDGMSQAHRFATELLDPILDHDSGSGQLLTTLRSFLEHGGQVRAASRALNVHENTVRYRLARIREIADIDVDDFETLVDLRFAIRMHDVVSGSDATRRDVPRQSSTTGMDD